MTIFYCVKIFTQPNNSVFKKEEYKVICYKILKISLLSSTLNTHWDDWRMVKYEWRMMGDEGWRMKNDDFKLLRGFEDKQQADVHLWT